MTNKDMSPNGWPDPQPLDGELPVVEPFTESLLPVSFRPMVCDAAERMSVPLDFPGVVAILTLAGTVNRRAVIEPMANDRTWLVVPNLWGGLIARPGEMKSPLIDAVCAPVEAIQEDWQREYDEGSRSTRQEWRSISSRSRHINRCMSLIAEIPASRNRSIPGRRQKNRS